MVRYCLILSLLALTSCAYFPHHPRTPNDARQVPVNQTVPTELQNGAGQ